MTTLTNLGVDRPAGYQLPGAYERRVPGNTNVGAANSVTIPCVIASGSRVRTYVDEAVTRGQVLNEAITVASTPNSHFATLSATAGALRDTATLSVARTLNGVRVVLPASAVSFRPAEITGTVNSAIDVSTGVAFGLVSDGGPAGITFLVRYVAGPAVGAPTVTVTGRQVLVEAAFSGTLGAAATTLEIATALNAAMANASVIALGYSGWTSAFSQSAGGFERVTTPSTLTNRGLRIIPAAPGGGLGTSTTLFGAATTTAPTVIAIDPAYYNALATYTATYVANDDTADAPLNTPTAIRRVGSYVGSSDFARGLDFTLFSGTVSWTNTSAVLTSSTTGNMDLSGGVDTFAVGVDSQGLLGLDLIQTSPVSVRLISGGAVVSTVTSSVVAGYATSGLTANAITPAQAVQQINALLAWYYGPEYAASATVSSSAVRVTSRLQGTQAAVTLTIDPSSTSSATAVARVFGSANPPGTTALGAGRTPPLGSRYYVTYDATRPTADYNTPVLLTDLSQVAARFGAVETAVPGLNPMAQALNYALGDLGVPLVYAVQINDSSVPGAPTAPEVQAALNAASVPSDIGGVVLFGSEIGSTSASVAALLQHLAATRNLETQRYRRVYFAPAASISLGSNDTPGSARFLASRTLQVPADSESRGAMYAAYWASSPNTGGAGTGIRRVLSADNGASTVTIDCGHEWLALWMCLTRESIAVAATLGGRAVPGFDLTNAVAVDNTTLKLAIGSGLCAASISTGVPVITEGVTTEQGGAADAQYAIDSSTTQSDAISRRVRAAINSLRYTVPDSPEAIERDVRRVISGALTAGISAKEAAGFTDSAGDPREVNENVDVRVRLNANDTREVFYGYQFVLRAPFVRAWGRSVARLV